MPLLDPPVLPDHLEIPVLSFPGVDADDPVDVTPRGPSVPDTPALASHTEFTQRSFRAPRRVVITGGCGFIGSNFIRYALEQRPDWQIINFDALTYAGNLENLRDCEDNVRYTFMHGDVRDGNELSRAVAGAHIVIHLAAESHVDRSIANGAPFIDTNVGGTQTLLDICREVKSIERIVVVSTDEVYGSLPLDDTTARFTEDSPLAPSSPYAASKAAADHLALAHHRTYDTPVIVTRCSNNFGPYQYPEKVIPLFVSNLMQGKPVPLYGDGRNVRDWIHVLDHCEALHTAATRGEPGRVYNIGADNERSNLELTHMILDIMGQPRSMIRQVTDRLGHDRRYAVDASRIMDELGWQPVRSAWPLALAETVAWYREHQEWLRQVHEDTSWRRAA